MTNLRAEVRILDGVATIRLVQILRNEGESPAEATWVLPLPVGAVADRFGMTVNGVRMDGDVLPAEQARVVYENIVRRRRDPGLLEYLGRGCLRARIFPIPPRGEVMVEVGFRQVLPEAGGLHRWTLALGAAGLDGRPPEHAVLELTIASRKPIRNAFSPASAIDVIEHGDHEATASFEGDPTQLPESELSVFYGLSEQEFGLNLLSHRKEMEREGTFLMLISPKRTWREERILRKTIVFVLDTSGSMSGRKIEQAKGALRFFVGSLRPEDRFDVIAFSTDASPFFGHTVPASSDSLRDALDRIARIEVRGGTDIDHALRTGLGEMKGDDDHVPILVFVTDGLPTIGERSPARILERVRRRNDRRTRIFVLGVGHGINTRLLDVLAAENGGTRDYVREGEDIEERASDLLTRLESPVMTDLELSVEGVRLSRMVPVELPDLFRGARLEIYGRYVGSGTHTVRLSGMVGGVRREYVYEGAFADGAVPDHDFVPSLWAERRVAVLLDAIRLNGEHRELLAEVRRLGREYRIVTPYTSHLIVEEGLRIASGPVTGGDRLFRGPGDSRPTGPGSPGSPGGGGGDPSSSGSFRPPSLDLVAERLRAAGVLPADAPPAELRRLASEVAREMRAGREGLRSLGRETSGRGAVEDSLVLARVLRSGASASDGWFLGRGRSARSGASVLDLFTKRVGGKVFLLRGGIWIDRGLGEDPPGERVVVDAYSDAYFDLLRSRSELQPYFAFSSRLIVAVGGEVFEVRESDGGEAQGG